MEQRQQPRDLPMSRSERVEKLSAPFSVSSWFWLIRRFIAVLLIISAVMLIIVFFFRAFFVSLSFLLILLAVMIGVSITLSGFLPKWVRRTVIGVISFCITFVFRLCWWFLSLLIRAFRWPLAMQILSLSQNRLQKPWRKFRDVSAEEAGGHAIIGHVIDGDLSWCLGSRLALPALELSKHGVVIGGSGSGKTVSLLRLASVAARVYGYRVYFLDCKGDRNTAAQFLAMMHQTGLKCASVSPSAK